MKKRDKNRIRQPEHYFNMLEGNVLIGRVAVESYIESGGHPADIHDLGEFLRSDEPPVFKEPMHPGFTEAPPVRGWQRKDYVIFGKWLANVVGPPPSIREATLNERIILKARDVGIGPGLHPIVSPARFGSLANFYAEAEIPKTRRMNAFHDWTSQDMVSYIKRLGKHLGRKPTRDDINEVHLKNPSKNPHSAIIYNKFKKGGGLRAALEMAGYVSPELWSDQEYIDWGVRFVKANNGKIPTSRDMNYLSSLRLGPSNRAAMDRFGKMRTYQDLVETSFIEDQENAKAERKRKIEEIELARLSGRIPEDLFDDSTDTDEIILRYARYIVVDAYMPDSMYVGKLSIAKMSNPTVARDGLIRAIKKNFRQVTPGDIESTAFYLGVYDELFSNDSGAIDCLKLPEHLRKSRQERLVKVRNT